MTYAQLHHGSHTAPLPTRIAGMQQAKTGGKARHTALLPTRIAGMRIWLWQAYRGWRARRQMLRTLYSLDHGTLKDIGVSPHEIESLVYGRGDDRAHPYDENWWRRG